MGNKCSKLEESNMPQTQLKTVNYEIKNLNDLNSKNEFVLDEDEKSRVSSVRRSEVSREISNTSLADSENETETQEYHVIQIEIDREEFSSDVSSDNDDEIETVKSKLFNSTDILLFNNNLDIRKIRRNKEFFRDPFFKPSIKVLSSSVNAELACSLFRSFQCKNTFDFSELSSLIKWERCAVISYNNRSFLHLKNEFVLNENGTPLPSNYSMYDYVNYFSIHDIFQGVLGDCFMIAAIMGITYNKELLAHVIPKDNASRNNMQLGAYHFRFWKLGNWYDLVIDDYLPVTNSYDLFFTKNLTYQNEYWIPLFEKAVAKFVGCYDLLHGGLLANSSLFLSGGIHDNYYTDLSFHITEKRPIITPNARSIFKFINEEFDNKPETAIPTINELFEILKFASRRKDLIGCYQLSDNIADAFGVYGKHQYLVSEVDQIKDIRYVKVHNPHNKLDDIKKKLTYQKFESILKSHGLWTSYPGEFFMSYEDFIKCFEGITVVNLLPEKEQALDSIHLGLIKKSTLFTRWKIRTSKGLLYPSNASRKKILKLKLKLTKSKPEYMIFSFCTAYMKTVPLVTLNIYRNDGVKAPKFIGNHHTIEFSGNHQQVFRVTLPAGEYTMFFEQNINKLVNEVEYCARIFTDIKSDNDIQVNFFEDQG
ncbi:unnamed protein product [Brachionus calyciflorus]|uniref:Calpain catalytic domain-containing protein n=1 Tax=Brachionus calyciflorus TaxID=104777 RepID=A0A813UDS7_9BILA|nr:unnamed protein product [Brachionus calyciflorus]